MTETSGSNQGLLNIGEQAKPPVAVLPAPSALFKSRAVRLAALAPGHDLEPYLRFLARLTEAQHAAAAALPAANGPLETVTRNDVPPLADARDTCSDEARAAITSVLDHLGEADLPEAAVSAIRSLRAAPAGVIEALALRVLRADPAADEGEDTVAPDVAQLALVAAGLQVHFSRLAAKLDVGSLDSVAGNACPACGSAPVASAIVSWPRASNTRFCACSLCGTMWHVVRVKCVLCSSTAGITYHAIEGKPDTVKAECCEACHAYVKVVNQTQDPALEPLADDVATLGLDMLMREAGWKRGGRNPFLLGY
ncbi:MAG: formate dehydrogenase accessory protein FdhE [Hyphomicrobium sp.]|nr:formate dehydrogenase accessory protein FdhE [Hyphomicrobium sp.]